MFCGLAFALPGGQFAPRGGSLMLLARVGRPIKNHAPTLTTSKVMKEAATKRGSNSKI